MLLKKNNRTPDNMCFFTKVSLKRMTISYKQLLDENAVICFWLYYLWEQQENSQILNRRMAHMMG